MHSYIHNVFYIQVFYSTFACLPSTDHGIVIVIFEHKSHKQHGKPIVLKPLTKLFFHFQLLYCFHKRCSSIVASIDNKSFKGLFTGNKVPLYRFSNCSAENKGKQLLRIILQNKKLPTGAQSLP